MNTPKNLILPEGSNLHRLISRAVKARKVHYNYLVVFKDVAGIGIQMAVADWLKPGQTYINGLER